MTTIGDRIKRARRGRRLPQRQLGRAVGTTHASIMRYERHGVVPPADVLAAIADELGVTIELLLGRVDWPEVKVFW